jgi:hypothetical protein
VHDYNGGIQPNGLFWSVEVPLRSFSLSVHQGRARFRVKDVPVVESFVFGGPNVVPALVSVDVEWDAVEAPMDRGLGTSVGSTDPGAFLGRFARARAVGSFSGSALGFEFRSRRGASSDQGFAEIGTERNGVFLT